MSEREGGIIGAWGGEVGPALEKARKSRGLSLKEAERSTSIRASYLEGLEKEDPAKLPGGSYVQAFLRSYAGFLELDAEELTRRFKESGGARKRQPRASRKTDEAESPVYARDGRRGGSVTLAISLTALALMIFVSTVYMLGYSPRLASDFLSGVISTDGEPGGKHQTPAPEQAQAPEGGATAEATVTRRTSTPEGEDGPSASESIKATIEVSGSESWISLESEQGVEYTGIAQPGFSRSFEVGDSFRITTGNAGAVELKINGQNYGTLGESGEVTARSFTLKKSGG